MYGYSVGNAAYYAALISFDPKILFALLRLIPAAIKVTVKEIRRADEDDEGAGDSARAVTRAWPGLAKTQTRGILAGVPAYVRSVRKQRRVAQRDPLPT
jgi:hypothetical protein